MGVFDKFRGAGVKARNAFEKAEAKFDSALDKAASGAKAARAKNAKRRSQIDTILGSRPKSRASKPVQIGPASSPFRSEPSKLNYGMARNVIYGEPDKPKAKKRRSVRIEFDD